MVWDQWNATCNSSLWNYAEQKQNIRLLLSSSSNHRVHYIWNLLAGQHSADFLNLVKLSIFAVSVPLQTAAVEQGFSIQSDILVSWNRLSSESSIHFNSALWGSINGTLTCFRERGNMPDKKKCIVLEGDQKTCM